MGQNNKEEKGHTHTVTGKFILYQLKITFSPNTSQIKNSQLPSRVSNISPTGISTLQNQQGTISILEGQRGATEAPHS